MYGDMKEATLEGLVRMTVLELGGLYYHTHDSRRSDPGFPDCTILMPSGKLMFRELKDQKGKLSPAQAVWRDRLLAAGFDWGLWRPSDWGTKAIFKELGQ